MVLVVAGVAGICDALVVAGVAGICEMLVVAGVAGSCAVSDGGAEPGVLAGI